MQDREAIATRRKAAEAKEDRTMKRLGLLPEVRKRAFVPDSDDDMEECKFTLHVSPSITHEYSADSN